METKFEKLTTILRRLRFAWRIGEKVAPTSNMD